MHPGARLCSQRELQQTTLLREMNFDLVVEKRITPQFRPPKDHLNCDPSLELEEMIVEAKPLHKKKKRLAKQRSIQRDTDIETTFIKEFLVYNRYKEVHRREMERKEMDWEQELATAMANSEVNAVGQGSLKTVQEDNTGEVAPTMIAGTRELNAADVDVGEQEEEEDAWDGTPIMRVIEADSNAVAGCTSGVGIGTSNNSRGGGTLIDFIDRTPSPKPSA